MASPAIVDFAKVTTPIAGTNPCGVNLRTDPGRAAFYDAVKDGRTKARGEEKKLYDGAPDASPGDWKAVLNPAVKTLSEKSKDLEITAYLIEAATRTYGFAGLRDGFRLARELVEKFWDNLFPMPDEEGIETRLFALIGLNGDDAEGTLIAPINRIPVTEYKGEAPFATYHYQEAQKTGKITDPKIKEKKLASGAVTMDKIAAAVSDSSNGFYKNLVEDLTGALDELGKLGTALDGKCGGKAPAWGQVRGALTTCLDAIKDVARAKLEVAVPKEEGKPGEAGAGPGDGEKKSGDQLQSRDDAFTLLLKVADFFRRTEPHSFVSYAVEQAVRWGRMPLPELLAELIAEEPSRKALYKQVGIRPPDPTAGAKK
ncbi:MAG TPA: type VI secretion system protein TssA [Gemmataceae bacterium]|nr:type VI secretion system protein TssA [Gemmataceae bacterium]